MFDTYMKFVLVTILSLPVLSEGRQDSLSHPNTVPESAIHSELRSESRLLSNAVLSELNADVVEEHENKPVTFPFIELIVRRTVKEYVRVIRTERNWLQRLLQLVREERVIRSRYNCSTDACIYKIQLFTHHIPLSLFQLKPIYRRRVRRSVPGSPVLHNPLLQEEGKDQLEEQRTNEGIKQQNGSITDSSVTQLKQNESVELSVIQDDALRLPEVLPSQWTKSNISLLSDKAGSLLESGNTLSKSAKFGDTEKYNLERVSQEVLSEALSKQSKSPFHRMPSVTEKEDTVHQSGSTDGTAINQNSSEPTVHLATESSTVKQDDSTQTDDTKLTQTEHPSFASDIVEGTTVVSRVRTSSEIPALAETTVLEYQLEEPNSEDELTGEIGNESQIPVVSPQESSSQQLSGEVDSGIHAIPFGLNQFAGRPYENCTGRFEHYCYNAHKCLYISVLETAVCYCRTGYTGVRCDMFNLPQTLDILKSFPEEVVDIPSFQQTSANPLYSVVEATARYTVNAVIEEDLLSTWNDIDIQ